MIEDYRALAGRIRQDLNDLDAVCSRVDAIWRRYQDSGDEYYIDAAALNVHDFYAGLERIFEAIARRIDQSMPEGPHWHEDLLDQMASTIPNTRPAVLSSYRPSASSGSSLPSFNAPSARAASLAGGHSSGRGRRHVRGRRSRHL